MLSPVCYLEIQESHTTESIPKQRPGKPFEGDRNVALLLRRGTPWLWMHMCTISKLKARPRCQGHGLVERHNELIRVNIEKAACHGLGLEGLDGAGGVLCSSCKEGLVLVIQLGIAPQHCRPAYKASQLTYPCLTPSGIVSVDCCTAVVQETADTCRDM